MPEFKYASCEDKVFRVPVVIKGDRSILVNALVDCGANFTFLDPSISDYLGLLKMGYEKVGVAGGTAETELTSIPELSLLSPDFTMRINKNNVNALLIPDLGEELVLGANFFEEKCKLIMDYMNMELDIAGDWEKVE